MERKQRPEGNIIQAEEEAEEEASSRASKTWQSQNHALPSPTASSSRTTTATQASKSSVTQTADNPKSKKATKFPFFDLPKELRLEIYELILRGKLLRNKRVRLEIYELILRGKLLRNKRASINLLDPSIQGFLHSSPRIIQDLGSNCNFVIKATITEEVPWIMKSFGAWVEDFAGAGAAAVDPKHWVLVRAIFIRGKDVKDEVFGDLVRTLEVAPVHYWMRVSSPGKRSSGRS